MEKADFLDRIASGLAKHGLKDDAILKYTERVSSLLDELPEAERRGILEGDVDVEDFVVGLLGESRAQKEPPKTATRPASAPQKSAPAAPAAPKAAPAVPASKAEATSAPSSKAAARPAAPASHNPTAPKAAPSANREPAKAPAASASKPAPAPQKPAPAASPLANKPARKPLDEKPTPAPARRGGPASAPTGRRAPQKPQEDEGSKTRPIPAVVGDATKVKVADNRDYSRFWVTVAALSPLLLLFAAATVLLFGGVVLAICAFAVGLVALLVAVAFGGTALTLVGIIYGATQLFEVATVSVGLYEIGTGLMIGGATLFLGILFYNGAVRLTPFLLRSAVHWIGILLRMMKSLYYRVKGAMAQ